MSTQKNCSDIQPGPALVAYRGTRVFHAEQRNLGIEPQPLDRCFWSSQKVAVWRLLSSDIVAASEQRFDYTVAGWVISLPACGKKWEKSELSRHSTFWLIKIDRRRRQSQMPGAPPQGTEQSYWNFCLGPCGACRSFTSPTRSGARTLQDSGNRSAPIACRSRCCAARWFSVEHASGDNFVSLRRD